MDGGRRETPVPPHQTRPLPFSEFPSPFLPRALTLGTLLPEFRILTRGPRPSHPPPGTPPPPPVPSRGASGQLRGARPGTAAQGIGSGGGGLKAALRPGPIPAPPRARWPAGDVVPSHRAPCADRHSSRVGEREARVRARRAGGLREAGKALARALPKEVERPPKGAGRGGPREEAPPRPARGLRRCPPPFAHARGGWGRWEGRGEALFLRVRDALDACALAPSVPIAPQPSDPDRASWPRPRRRLARRERG